MILLDETDVRLVTELRKNGRSRIVALAKMLNVPKSTVYDRLRKLKRAGVRYTSLLHWEYLGCSLVVCFIAPYSVTLAQHPNVNTCLRLSPEALFIECVFATMSDVEAFRATIAHGRVYPVISVLKKEGFVPEVHEPLSL